jgi:chromate reductase
LRFVSSWSDEYGRFRGGGQGQRRISGGMSAIADVLNCSQSDTSEWNPMDMLILAGSTRKASLNAELARHMVTVATRDGVDARFIDLSDFEMPMYNFDFEEAVGPPRAAVELHDLIKSAQSVVLVSPEYNGGPTPVLKNAIDWVSRVTKRPLEGKRVGLVSATPGAGGGVTGLAGLRLILTSMRADLPPHDLAVGNGRAKLEALDADLDEQIVSFLSHVTSAEAIVR